MALHHTDDFLEAMTQNAVTLMSLIEKSVADAASDLEDTLHAHWTDPTSIDRPATERLEKAYDQINKLHIAAKLAASAGRRL